MTLLYLYLFAAASVGALTIPRLARWRYDRAIRYYRSLPSMADVPAWFWLIPGSGRCVAEEPSYIGELACCALSYGATAALVPFVFVMILQGA